MPDKVTLVRHDGSLMDATPEQAGRLKILGYQEVTPEQNLARLTAESRADYYQAPGQQLRTASEGIANGLDFGLTDYLFGDDETKARAAYNPGLRMGTEALGAMLPMFLTGGESAAVSGVRGIEEAGVLKKFAGIAPTSLLSDAAHALAPERTFTGALTRGIVEGAAYGGAGAADHAYLDGEPITAETVLHGIGWGAIIGGGLGLVGHGIEAGGEVAAASKEAEFRASQPVPKGALNTMAGSEYGALRDEVANLGTSVKGAVAIADSNAAQVLGALKKAGETDATVNLTRFNQISFGEDIGKAEKLWDKAKQAASAGGFEKANTAIDDYTTHAKDIAKRLNIEVPDPAKSLQELAAMRNVGKILGGMPKNVEAFASMGAQKMEATVAALERVKSLPFTNGIDEASNNFKQALGLDTASADLRAAHKTSKSLLQSEGKTPPQPKKNTQPGLLRQAVGYAAGGKAWLAAKATGFGRVGAYTAYRSVRDAVTYGSEHFAGVKAAAISGIREAAALWGPAVGRGVQKTAGASTNSLNYSIFGEPDKGTRDAKDLAARRVAEIAAFAPTAANSIYKAVQPIAITQPMLAPSIHKSALQAFQALQAMAPRDPGAISALKSIWKPSDLQAAIFAKQLAVFNDPVGEAIGLLTGERQDIVKVQALQKIAPSVYQEYRDSLLQRLSQPGVLDKATPGDQVFLSVALGFPVHSRMSAGQISTGQQIFTDRNEPLKANPRIGPGGGLPSPGKDQTSAQKSTER